MKNLICTLIILIFSAFHGHSQQHIFRQYAIVIDSHGRIVPQHNMEFNIRIFEINDDVREVYSESHHGKTDSAGVLTFSIGKGRQLSGELKANTFPGLNQFATIESKAHVAGQSIFFLPFKPGFQNDVFMKWNEDGFVLKNNNPPGQLAIDLEAMARLTPAAAVGDCHGNSTGALYYDSNLKAFCFCDGTSWKKFDGGDCAAQNEKNNKSNGGAPVIALELSSVMRIIPSIFQDICDPSMEGSLFFDSQLNEFCYCDGLAWQQVDGGGACGCADNDGDGYDVCDASHPNDTDGYAADCNDADIGINPGASELCNGVDDDCDGVVDEGFGNVGQPCVVGIGACERTGYLVCKSDGTGVECNVTAGTPVSELCNGLDDDCDGVVDEGFGNIGQPCTVGVGACLRTGVLVCSPDGTGVECSVSAGNPTAEICNGLDDDCDGQVDENTAQEGSPCDGPDADLCEEGTWTCINGTLICNDNTDDNVEICNGADDDCDGQVDENAYLVGTVCDGSDTDLCPDGLYECLDGLLYCNDDANSITEICNGADDDCDGQVDEDFANLGQPCTVGVGACERTGVFVCKADGTGVECSVSAGNPVAELCNGIDDDCDGQVDEDYTYNGSPVGSSCDGIGVCGQGTVECSPVDGTVTCSTNPNGSEYQGTAEVCDGEDNDCDGQIDESDPLVGSPCDGSDSDLCLEGVYQCISGTLVCSDNTSDSLEVCNGLDDDCDGLIDEDFDPNNSPPCSGFTDLGSVSGDTGAVVLTVSDWKEAWYRVTIVEDDFGANDIYLSAEISLYSPPGTDFDLFVDCDACGGLLAGQSTNTGTGGHYDTVLVRMNDNPVEDSFQVIIEIRYNDALYCGTWDLEVTGNMPAAIVTCN